MSRKPGKRHFRSLAETASILLDPILRKRTGLNIELMENWPQIVGEATAQSTLPLKIIWARRASQDDPFQPATLVVACEGFAAMKLQHESGEVIQRINAFFGYVAINRLKIEQRAVRFESVKPVARPPVDERDKVLITQLAAGVEDEGLRRSLCELGLAVFAEKNAISNKKFSK
ncbi:DUF721 domain-containing protein [Bartonella sp. LJL80]